MSAQHKVRCPDCQTVFGFRVRDGDPEGARIRLACPHCGARLQTRIPGKPKPAAADVLSRFADLCATAERLGIVPQR